MQQCALYLRRAVANSGEGGDMVAREQMCLASTAAGVGFGKIIYLLRLFVISCQGCYCLLLFDQRQCWCAPMSCDELSYFIYGN